MREIPTIRLFFFGDSISFGQGVSPHKIWMTRVAEGLSREFEGRLKLVAQNPSINGNTTRMALERMPHDVQSHNPDILVVQFGMNDCNVWQTDNGLPRVSPDGFVANLSEIIDRGRAAGARHVILGASHSTTRTRDTLPNVDYSYEQSNKKYNALVRNVARSKGAVLSDLEAAFDRAVAAGNCELADLLLPDELHLSERGHDVYFEHYYPLVRSAVAATVEPGLAKVPVRGAA